MLVKLGIVGLAIVAAFSNAALAAPCANTSLTDYLAADFSCTVSDKTFSGFTYTPTNTVQAAAVTVAPIGADGNNPGLQFSAAWNEAAGSTGSFTLGFIAVIPSSANFRLSDASLALAGTVGDGGSFSAKETLSVGDLDFATLNASNTTLTASTNIGGLIFAFNAVTMVSLTGPEMLSMVTERFSETSTPEPASLTLLGIGLCALGVIRSRKRQS